MSTRQQAVDQLAGAISHLIKRTAALPFYERHPEWKARPWRRGQLRCRARMIRESL
jgi:hypothetical protein